MRTAKSRTPAMSAQCPLCGRQELETLLRGEDVAAELRLREAFFAARIEGPLHSPDMKDRTDVLHATASAILICRGCGVLVREPDEREFDQEQYAPAVMERMLRSNIDAFRHKERQYRPLLPEGASVLEVGSFVGGFLHVALEWGWSATGVDVGEDTAQFTAAHGYPTIRTSLAESGLEPESFDGVFVWTCFEQIDPPAPLLDHIARVLRPDGLLVIRTPNALFYASCEALMSMDRAAGKLTEHDPIVRLLAWNNLLGFSHQYGYGPRSLDVLLASHQFALVARHGDTLIVPSHARLTALARREEDATTAALREMQRAVSAFDPAAVTMPWFEAVYRKSPSC